MLVYAAEIKPLALDRALSSSPKWTFCQAASLVNYRRNIRREYRRYPSTADFAARSAKNNSAF